MAELSNDSKLNISFKHLQGKSQTENAWGPEGEQVGIFFNIPSDVIFSELIPYYPLDAISSGTAKKITADLIVDPASNGHAYFAVWRSGEAWYPSNTVAGNLVKNTIQPSYNDPFDTLGRNYNAIPYDTSNNFISETDARAWVYQYQSGVFYQQETNGTTPDHIDLYVYSGRYLSDELSGFTSGLSNLLLNDLNDVTINNVTLQNFNVLMYSGGTSGGTWINFNIEDRYVNVEGDTMTGTLIISGAGYLTLTHGGTVNEISEDSGFTDASPNALVTEEAIAAAFNNIENNVYTKTESDDRFVNVTGDTMTGDLIMSHLSGETIRSTYFDTDGRIILGKDYSFETSLTGNTNVDSFAKSLDYSCIWEYSIKNDNNSMRTGTISSVWYSTNDSLIYNHISTNDIGDTRDLTFDVLIISDQVRLNALTTGTWAIKIKRRFI